MADLSCISFQDRVVRSLSRYEPMEMHCESATSQRDVSSFIRSVLSKPPALLSGTDLEEAVETLLKKTEVGILLFC